MSSPRKGESAAQFRARHAAYMRDYYHRMNDGKKRAYIARNTGYAKDHPVYKRDHHFRSKYGISLKEYQEMAERQQGCCAVCGTLPIRRLQVEHCHVSGRVRGLVCSPCNTVIGHLENNPGTAEALVTFLSAA